MQSDNYKGLEVEEKRGIQARIRTKMLRLKGEKDEVDQAEDDDLRQEHTTK